MSLVVQFFGHVLVPSDKKHNDDDEENIEGSQCDHDWVLPVDEEPLLLILLLLPLLSLYCRRNT